MIRAVLFSILLFSSHTFLGQDKAEKRYYEIENLFHLKDYDGALALIEKGLRKTDDFFHIMHYQKAACLYKLEDYTFNQLDSILQIALQIEKKNKKFDLCMGNSYWLYSSLYDNVKDFDKSKGYIQLSLKHFNKNSTEYSSLISNLGLLHMSLEEYEKAVKVFTQSLKHNPNNAYGYNNRALAYIKLGNLKMAKIDLEESFRLDDKNPYLFKHYALYYLEQKRTEKACLMLNKAERLGYYDFGLPDKNEVRDLMKTHCN